MTKDRNWKPNRIKQREKRSGSAITHFCNASQISGIILVSGIINGGLDLDEAIQVDSIIFKILELIRILI